MDNMITNNWLEIDHNLFLIEADANQDQHDTNKAFTEKWEAYSKDDENNENLNKTIVFQNKWFLSLYGYESEIEIKKKVCNSNYILDAGCGLGQKASWLAEMAPESKVIAIDFSDSIYIAYKNYKDKYPNMIFAKRRYIKYQD